MCVVSNANAATDLVELHLPSIIDTSSSWTSFNVCISRMFEHRNVIGVRENHTLSSLDLGHGWSALANTTATAHATRAATVDERSDERSSKSCEQEPVESGTSLELTASL